MGWWEWFGVLAGSGGLVASVLGAWLTYAARWNGERTRDLMRSTQADTQALLREMQAETRALLERMDQRADDRHREMLQVVQALRG
jgi:hypothetical protein